MIIQITSDYYNATLLKSWKKSIADGDNLQAEIYEEELAARGFEIEDGALKPVRKEPVRPTAPSEIPHDKIAEVFMTLGATVGVCVAVYGICRLIVWLAGAIWK